MPSLRRIPPGLPLGPASLVGLVGLVGLCGGPAQAAPHHGDNNDDNNDATVEFRWDAPNEGCPPEAEVLDALERLLGGPVGAQGDRRLTAIARARREADGSWDLRLWTVTDDATRQRSMTGQDCTILADAAALLAAMAIDPSALERAETTDSVAQAEQARELDSTEPAPESEPEPKPEPEPEPEPEPLPDPQLSPEPRPFDVALGLGGGVSTGALPGAGALLGLGLGLVWDHARFEIGLHYAFERKARFDDNDLGADLSMAFAAVRGCAVLRHRPAKLEFPLCLGLEAGAQFGRGVGFTIVDAGALPWLALDLSPGIAWRPHPHVALGLRAEPFVPLGRPTFEADGTGELWRPGALGFRALAAIESRF